MRTRYLEGEGGKRRAAKNIGDAAGRPPFPPCTRRIAPARGSTLSLAAAQVRCSRALHKMDAVGGGYTVVGFGSQCVPDIYIYIYIYIYI